MIGDHDRPILVSLRLRLQPRTLAWLERLEITTGDDPETMIASMLEMIRVDDEIAHHEDRSQH